MLENKAKDKIITKEINDELRSSFLDYSMSVITSRTLPDARDGLKPVHRRILYSMWEQNMLSDKTFYKSARIVGNVIGKYHPHGDISVYDALVRLTQPWNMMTPLANGQGNFGSMDGDSAAAMRYTESKMSKIAEVLMKNINKNNVEFRDNYDGMNKEPVVLPAKFPNLLVNGVHGIAVGMASNMPPHNLSETIDAIEAYIQNEDITVDELLEFLPGPDLPTGGCILGTEGIKQAYETGKGKIKIRGKVHIEEFEGRNAIVITQIPYQVNKSYLMDKIKEVQVLFDTFKKNQKSNNKQRTLFKKPAKALNFTIRDGVIDDSDTNSTENDLRIVIKLLDGIDPNVVINHLFKYTPLEVSFSFNNTVLVPLENNKMKPKCLGLKPLIQIFVHHQLDVLRKELTFDLDKYKRELHFLDAMIKVSIKIDDTVDVIKTSKTNEEAIEGLKKLLAIDNEQAQYILKKQLRSLSQFQQTETLKKHTELKMEIDSITNILSSENEQKKLIIEELQLIKDSFGQERRTELLPAADYLTEIDLIQNERVVITLSNNGYIKSTKETTYKLQKRNGRGVNGMSVDDDDFVLQLDVMYKHDHLLLFSNKGRVYLLKGFEIPETRPNAKGTHIYNLLPGMDEEETIQTIMSIKRFDDQQYLFFTTKNGLVKKTALSEYENIRQTGIVAIQLNEGDSLVNVNLTSGKDRMVLLTANGQSIVFNEIDVRNTKRNTQGVIGIKLINNDKVVCSDICDETNDLFIITENGYSKKTPVSEFSVQQRGGIGARALKVSKKTGLIVSSVLVFEKDSLFVLSTNGQLIKISAEHLSTYKRNAQGTKTINLKEDDLVKKAVRVSDDSGAGN